MSLLALNLTVIVFNLNIIDVMVELVGSVNSLAGGTALHLTAAKDQCNC